MEILVDRKQILSKFLVPINKFTDQAIITLNKDYIDCVSYTSNDKQSILLYTKLMIKTNITDDAKITLNIGNIKKLISALGCISTDIIKLIIEKNHIAHVSPEATFKFHLKEDGTIEKPTANIEKINAMSFNTNIDLSAVKIDDILKASNFSSDSNKIYLTIKDNSLIAELTDKTIPNLDTISVVLTDQITGIAFKESIALRLDIFRLISSIKYDKLTIRINDKGVVVFEINENDYLMKYITSSLIK